MSNRRITVRIVKHAIAGRWVCVSDDIGWTGPSFPTKKSAKRWALKIGYFVHD